MFRNADVGYMYVIIFARDVQMMDPTTDSSQI